MSSTTNGSEPKLSLVIPCLNEAANVVLVIDRLAELSKTITAPFEVIFVDGGSRDGTPDAINARVQHHGLGFVRVDVMKDRGGYGRDIMMGLRQARAEVLAWTHADMQTDIKDVFDAYALFQRESASDPNIVIKGKRQNRPLFDALFSFGMQVFTFVTLGVNINDINAQPKMFSRAFFERHLLDDPPNDFSLDLFALFKARKNGYRILTVPVYFTDRLHGEAKGGGGGLGMKVALTKRTVKFILATRRRVRA